MIAKGDLSCLLFEDSIRLINHPAFDTRMSSDDVPILLCGTKSIIYNVCNKLNCRMYGTDSIQRIIIEWSPHGDKCLKICSIPELANIINTFNNLKFVVMMTKIYSPKEISILKSLIKADIRFTMGLHNNKAFNTKSYTNSITDYLKRHTSCIDISKANMAKNILKAISSNIPHKVFYKEYLS